MVTNKIIKSLKYLPVIAVVIMLTACFGGGDNHNKPLEGKRINVMTTPTSLLPDTSVYNIKMKLPPQINITDWSQVGGFAHHRPTHVKLADKVVKGWRKSLGGGMTDTSILLNPPVIANGKLFAINTKGKLFAIDTQNGKIIWKKNIEISEEEQEGFSGGIATAAGYVFVTTGTGEIFAYSTNDGSKIWDTSVSLPLRASPTIADGKLFVVSYNNRLFALSAVDGSLLWTHSGIEEELAIMGGASPAVDNGIIIVPYSSGEIYALNAENGQYLWHDALSSSASWDSFSSLADVEATPVIASGMVYAVNHNGWVSVFDLENGRRIWERELSSTQMPWIVGNAIFVVSDDNKLVALHRKDGRIRWVVELNNFIPVKKRLDVKSWSGPILAGERLIVVSSNGYALSLNPYTGERLKLAKIADEISLPPISAAGTLYFMSDDAEIITFR